MTRLATDNDVDDTGASVILFKVDILKSYPSLFLWGGA
jgi:hypothetical protein